MNIVILVFFYYGMIKRNNTNILGLDYATLILIYALLWMILSSFSQTSSIIGSEAKIGTIEKLIVSPYGIRNIVLVRLFLQSAISIFFITIVLLMTNSLTQNFQSFNIFNFMATLIIGIFGLYGIGIILASISLLSKEVNIITTIIKIAMMYIIVKFDTNIFIPFSYAKNILAELILNNKLLLDYSPYYLFMFLLNSVIFFAIGLICFSFIEKLALKKGNFVG